MEVVWLRLSPNQLLRVEVTIANPLLRYTHRGVDYLFECAAVNEAGQFVYHPRAREEAASVAPPPPTSGPNAPTS